MVQVDLHPAFALLGLALTLWFVAVMTSRTPPSDGDDSW